MSSVLAQPLSPSSRTRRPERRALRRHLKTAAAAAVVALAVGATGAVDAQAAEPNGVPMAFDVQGSANVRTGIRGTVTIAGTFTGTYYRDTGTYSGSFSLTPTQAHVTVLGLIPVTAETDWLFSEPVTGTWRDGVLSMRAAARIHHPRLLAFGSIPVAGGGRCATRLPSVIELRSSASTPVLSPLDGGTISTWGPGFTISPLSGCGALDGLLSAVAAGGGNQATVSLTPRAG